MTRRSHWPRYLRLCLGSCIGRLGVMRVRRFELRLIAVGLVAAWGLAAALVLLVYRPGGPLDIAVGITMLMPIGIALTAIAFPPVPRGDGAFPLMVALGVGSLLVLLPSIGGVLDQLVALGSQTLLPSLEAAYPWLVALIGTSLFTGFGLARRTGGGAALRPRRLLVGVAAATGMTIVAGGAFAGVAIGNEIALRERPAAVASRFGPVGVEGEPMACDGQIAAGPAARLVARFQGDVDGRSIGSVDLTGIRAGRDVRWLAYVATFRELGQYGGARSGGRGWVRTPTVGWREVSAVVVRDATVDLRAIDIALTAGYRATAENRGIELIVGARARHCRIAVDGATFQAAFPQVGFLVGDADLARWRGQVDYWIFMDGQVGQIAAQAGGEAAGIRAEALQATVSVVMTATERDRGLVVYPPGP